MMVNPTSPDSMPRWENRDPASLVQVSQALGDGFQAALDNRQRFDFIWTSDAERDAQLGMVAGSRGYQGGTRAEYIYDGTTWILVTGHAEYTFNQSMVRLVQQGVGVLTLDEARTTSPTMTSTETFPDTGLIIVKNPGIYAYFCYANSAATMTGRSLVEIAGSTDYADKDSIFARVNLTTTEDITSLSVANLFLASANYHLYTRVYHSNAVSVVFTGRIMLTRIG